MDDSELECLKDIVKNEFDQDLEWITVDEGLNTIYRLEAGDKSFIIKVHTNEENKIEWFTAEPKIYGLLAENTDLSSPEVIYRDFSEDKIDDSFYIMEKMPGKNPDKKKKEISDEKLNNILYQYGKILGNIHDFSPEFDDYGFLSGKKEDLNTTESADRWTWSIQGAIESWSDIVQDKWEDPVELEIPERKIRENIPAEPRAVLIHSDNRLDNLLIKGNEITGFLDWSHPRTGHSEYDLARAEYLLIDWDLDFKDVEAKESLRKSLYEGYKQNNTIAEDFEERKQIYRYATTAWLAAGFANWGSNFNQEEYSEMRNNIVERIKKETP